MLDFISLSILKISADAPLGNALMTRTQLACDGPIKMRQYTV